MNTGVSDISSNGQNPPLWDDATLSQLRKELVRFAVLQLRNRDIAEDVVQEALASAIAASDRFERRASVKTWVFTILKNKIVDVLRDRWNKNRVDLIDEASDESDFDILFTGKERWQRSEMPSPWGDPEQSFENHEFWEIFDICMNNLPEVTARVFTMREFLGLEAHEICKELEISTSNCWVILHRARMGLRLCLQQRWFEGGESK
ncbi:MAG: sigma-70 family RNA polymerase sigma factor [Burkholderiales bacterium]|nr:sigma-70 family RNA polymerase sigma factor [Burkholderiales bacterium]